MPKFKFVTDVKTATRMWSVRFMVLMSTIGSVVLANPSLIYDFKNQLPAEVQAVVPVFVWGFLIAASFFLRIAAQRKLFEHWEAKHDDPSQRP